MYNSELLHKLYFKGIPPFLQNTYCCIYYKKIEFTINRKVKIRQILVACLSLNLKRC